MSKSIDHPLRYAIVNELHARPFPQVSVPSHAIFVAIKEPSNAQSRDRARDRDHLSQLMTRNGATLPEPDATHFSADIGRYKLKWESHSEFVTYSAFGKGLSARPFDPATAEVFPTDWLATAPGKRICSILFRIEHLPDDEAEMMAKLDDWFVAESLAVSRIVDGAAVVAGDFRIDPAGHMRFAVFVRPGTGERRVGRILQRLCEVETYRAMSMLGFIASSELTASLNALEPKLSGLVSGLDESSRSAEGMLHDLLSISAELESLAVRYGFRFGATAAYKAIVAQRIEIMREARLHGRQSFAEFMTRRYDPAMRTVQSSEMRLRAMAERAQRAAELLRTRVDVERSAQNQRVLQSMDRRADMQLRLQHTVEGLSVVAISYYAVSLVSYVLYPLAKHYEISKELMMVGVTPVVILLVWLMIRRIKNHFA